MTIKITVRRYYDNTGALSWLFTLERAGENTFSATTYLYTNVQAPPHYGNYSHIDNGRFVYTFRTLIDRNGMPVADEVQNNEEPVGPSPVIRQLNTNAWTNAVQELEQLENNQ